MRRKFPETVYPLNISLEEAYKGKTSKLKLSKKVLCTSCKGLVIVYFITSSLRKFIISWNSSFIRHL